MLLMAISTYSELKTSLGNWLHRSDLASIIPDFITLNEADFNRKLRIAQMEFRATATFDEGYEDLPSDYLELREIKVNSSTPVSLKYVTPEYMSEAYPTAVTGDQPTVYTLVDTQVRLNAIPSAEVEIAYYVKLDALSEAAPTNWLLTNHPDVYLFGSLMFGAIYLRKPAAEIAGWKSLYEEKLKEVEDADKRARWSGSALTVRTA
jgi:hypothetical protein